METDGRTGIENIKVVKMGTAELDGMKTDLLFLLVLAEVRQKLF